LVSGITYRSLLIILLLFLFIAPVFANNLYRENASVLVWQGSYIRIDPVGTRQIVETLPAHLKEGIIVCSLEKINHEGPCPNAAENNQKDLTITPGDNFPCITFPTFYPYLDFILRAGPVDFCHMKKTFKVEGSFSLIEAVLQFKENRVRNVSGTILVFVKISLCKGDVAVKLHEFEKEIEVA